MHLRAVNAALDNSPPPGGDDAYNVTEDLFSFGGLARNVGEHDRKRVHGGRGRWVRRAEHSLAGRHRLLVHQHGFVKPPHLRQDICQIRGQGDVTGDDPWELGTAVPFPIFNDFSKQGLCLRELLQSNQRRR